MQANIRGKDSDLNRMRMGRLGKGGMEEGHSQRSRTGARGKMHKAFLGHSMGGVQFQA